MIDSHLQFIEHMHPNVAIPYKERLNKVLMPSKSEKLKIPEREYTEYMKKLQVMEPCPDAYVHEKQHIGFPGWTFEELCKYLGFAQAQDYVKKMKRSQFIEHVYSMPVKTYCELFWNAYRIDIKNGEDLYYVIVGGVKGTDVFGCVLNEGGKVKRGEHYRDLEARLDIDGGFEEIKRHYTHTVIEDLNKSNSRKLISQQGIMQRPVVRR